MESNYLLELDNDLRVMFMVCGLMKDQLIHIFVRDKAVINDLQLVVGNISFAFPLNVGNTSSLSLIKDSSMDVIATIDSNVMSSSCLSSEVCSSNEDVNQY